MKNLIAAVLIAGQISSCGAFADRIEMTATGIACIQPFPMETALDTVRFAANDAENSLKHQCQDIGGTLAFRSQKIDEIEILGRCVKLTATQACSLETTP